jgi:hypothetical protein
MKLLSNNGSLVAARLVRVAPQVVHTLAVVDPVSPAAAAAVPVV